MMASCRKLQVGRRLRGHRIVRFLRLQGRPLLLPLRVRAECVMVAWRLRVRERAAAAAVGL